MCFFFFFQAEDGIRDLTVTGVQTCALPISPCQTPEMNIVNTRGNISSTTNAQSVVLGPLRTDSLSANRRRVNASMRGLKTYAVRKRVSVMCQCSQKSMMLEARRGE